MRQFHGKAKFIILALFFAAVSSVSLLAPLMGASLAEQMLGIEPSKVKGYHHISVLGDPHLPGRHLAVKEGVIDTINNWEDVDEVVCVGDLCETVGTDAEFAAAKRYLSAFRKPLEVVNGNHDYVFSNNQTSGGHLTLGDSKERKSKLQRFRQTYGQLSTNKIVKVFSDGEEYSYHLIFLGVDSLTSPYYCCLSDKTQKWLKKILNKNKGIPAIVFCHSPLWGRAVLQMNPKLAYFMTQPVEAMENIVKDAPDMFLWVAGHCHLGANNPVATGKLNYFLKQVYSVNNCDLDGRSILNGADINLEYHSDVWTKSLLLYPHKVIVKTYDHVSGRWLDEKEQTIEVKRAQVK